MKGSVSPRHVLSPVFGTWRPVEGKISFPLTPVPNPSGPFLVPRTIHRLPWRHESRHGVLGSKSTLLTPTPPHRTQSFDPSPVPSRARTVRATYT